MSNEWTDAEGRVDRAHVLYEQGRWAEAAAELQAAIDINPLNPLWHFNLGLTLEALEDYERAGAVFARALEMQPNDIETLNCLGVNMTRQGKYAEALNFFACIEKLDPNYEPSYCNRIITYTEMGQHDQAELMFYLARQVKDDCSLCYYNIAASLYNRGQYDAAINCLQQVLRLDPKHPQTNVHIAEAYWAKGELDQAAKHYRMELDVAGEDVETMLDLGELMMEMDRPEHAAALFRRALAQGDNADAFFCLGELALQQKNFDEAAAFFQNVLAADENYAGAHARLAQVCLARGQSMEAAKHLTIELKRCGDDAVMLAELGQLLLEAHMARQANAVFQRLVTLRPEDPDARHSLAVSYFELKMMDEGIRQCRRALKLQPQNPQALYNLALAHVQTGSIRRARRYLWRAMSLAPQDQTIRQLGKKLNMTGLLGRLGRRFEGFAWRWMPL